MYHPRPKINVLLLNHFFTSLIYLNSIFNSKWSQNALASLTSNKYYILAQNSETLCQKIQDKVSLGIKKSPIVASAAVCQKTPIKNRLTISKLPSITTTIYIYVNNSLRAHQ